MCAFKAIRDRVKEISFNDPSKFTRAQKFIEQNKKKLEDSSVFFNPDTAFQPAENYSDANLRVLIVFGSPASVKAVSSTAAALNSFVTEICNSSRTKEQNSIPKVNGARPIPEPNERGPLKVFMDFTYVPNGSDMKLFDKNNMPYAIGNITHLDASYFDVVGFSISVLSEVITCPNIIKSFSRCDYPIPLTWTERKGETLGKYPLIYAGGITAACSDIMFGDLGDGRQAFVDFLYLGSCEKMDIMWERHIEAIDHNRQIDEMAVSEGEEIPPFPPLYQHNGVDLQGLVSTQDYINSIFDMPMVYQPQAYKVVFDNRNRVIENTKINEYAQDFVKPYYPLEIDEDCLGIGMTIIQASGDNVGTSQIQVSEGCSAAGACSFCAEGNYTGGWVEKSKERILWEARESKKYSAGYKMKPFSFNCNYVTDYKGILYDFMKIYPKVTFINMRMEELGRDVDALRMMKLVGSNRISAPMEGISPRIQNNLLNKCLSEEALTNFMDDMVHARLTDIKVGGIFTGYEEDEDFQWICDFVDRYKQRAAMENGNFPFRLKVTPLVHYNLTPIEYLERKSARKSYEGEHWLTDEWYEKFREHNVFFKVNGFRYSTFIEQSIIDLGRSATKWMYDNIVSQNLPVYSLRSFATKEIVDNLKKIVNKDWFFEARNPEHYISISHRIHIDLMGSYIPRARRLVRLAEQEKILDNPMDIRCLKTFADAKTKCYASCVSKDPLKIYKDVKLDENDNLVGEFRELKGCERCPDKEHRMNRLARPIISSKNSEDIIALPKLKPVQRVRFVLRRTVEYCVLNPNNTAHTFMAKFLQKSERLVDIYHSIAGHNFFWHSDADIPYEVSGFQVVDALFTSNEAYSIIESLANEVSRELKSVKIISFKKEFVEDTIKVNDFNIYRFETSLPYDLFASACISYKGEIRVKKDVLLETITDKSLKKPVFITAGKTIGYFVLPMKYNPYLYLQGLLKDKKIPLTKLRQEVNIDNVLIARESSNICTCGKEKGVISLITGKQMKFGLDCLPTALMKVELNKKK